MIRVARDMTSCGMIDIRKLKKMYLYVYQADRYTDVTLLVDIVRKTAKTGSLIGMKLFWTRQCVDENVIHQDFACTASYTGVTEIMMPS